MFQECYPLKCHYIKNFKKSLFKMNKLFKMSSFFGTDDVVVVSQSGGGENEVDAEDED